MHPRSRLALLLGSVALASACAAPRRAPDPAPVPQVGLDSLPLPDTTPVVVVDSVPPVTPDTAPGRRTFADARVCAGGDVTIGTNLDTSWAARRGVDPFPDPDRLVSPLAPLVADAQIVLLNVEGAIGEGPAPRKCREGSTNCYAFRQPVPVAGALRRVNPAAAVVGNVANNHARDAGVSGLALTVRHLREAEVYVTGADTIATLVPLPDGDTVAVLGFSTSGGPDPRDLAAVRRHVARAAAAHPRVVVTMHMGAEGSQAQRTPDATEMFLGINRGNSVAFARTAVESGADAVIGHGPHVMRAAEWQGDALILYSLGNLLTYGPFSMDEPKNRGAIACVVLDPEGRVVDAELRSTRQVEAGVLVPDPTRRAAVLVDSLSRLDFPSTAPRVEQSRLLRPRAP